MATYWIFGLGALIAIILVYLLLNITGTVLFWYLKKRYLDPAGQNSNLYKNYYPSGVAMCVVGWILFPLAQVFNIVVYAIKASGGKVAGE